MKLFQDMKKNRIEPSLETITAYFQASGKTTKVVKTNSTVPKGGEEEEVKTGKSEVSTALYNAVIELPNKCGGATCGRFFREEELMSGWSRNLNTYTVKCPACGKEFVPNLQVTLAADKVAQFYFLFPPLFAKEVYNLIEFKTSSVFFSVISCE